MMTPGRLAVAVTAIVGVALAGCTTPPNNPPSGGGVAGPPDSAPGTSQSGGGGTPAQPQGCSDLPTSFYCPPDLRSDDEVRQDPEGAVSTVRRSIFAEACKVNYGGAH